MTTADIIAATIGLLALVVALTNLWRSARASRQASQAQFVAKITDASGKFNRVQNEATSRSQQILGVLEENSVVLKKAATRGLPQMRERASELENDVVQLHSQFQQVDQEFVSTLREVMEELDAMQAERASGATMAPVESVLRVFQDYVAESERRNIYINLCVSRFREVIDRLNNAVDRGIEAVDRVDEAIDESRKVMGGWREAIDSEPDNSP